MKRRNRTARKHLGFTLIEVLVAVTIIGIMAGFALPKITSVRETMKAQTAKTEMQAVLAALQTYKSKYNKYPPYGSIDNGYPELMDTTKMNVPELRNLFYKQNPSFHFEYYPFTPWGQTEPQVSITARRYLGQKQVCYYTYERRCGYKTYCYWRWNGSYYYRYCYRYYTCWYQYVYRCYYYNEYGYQYNYSTYDYSTQQPMTSPVCYPGWQSNAPGYACPICDDSYQGCQ